MLCTLLFFRVDINVISQNFELLQNCHLLQLVVASEARVLELRRLLRLEVGKLPEEATQLNQNHKDFLVVRAVTRDEALEAPVVLNNWIVLKLFENLPVLGQLVLGLGVVEYAEDFNA